MDWDKLKAFYIVAKTENISRASEQMNLSQPAISRQIQFLEAQLCTKLFTRHAKGLKLTAKGIILFEAVRKVDQELEIAKSHILDYDKSYEGEFKVLSTVGFASSYLSPYISDFLKQYPDLHLSLIASDNLSSFNLQDINMLIHPKIESHPDIIQEPLMRVVFKLYASKEYLEQYGMPQTLDDLDNHRLIAYGDFKNHPFSNLNWHLTAGRANKQMRTPHTTVNFALGRLSIAEKGHGIISVPHNHPHLKNRNLVEVLPHIEGPSTNMYMIYFKHQRKHKKLQAFKAFMEENFKDL